MTMKENGLNLNNKWEKMHSNWRESGRKNPL